ncbi:MAG: hypothetical protein HY747_03620 [Elusimicrobia bacterium]|nr:hypothetical protein [Elusimicrobiota bacterium]
MKLTIYIDGACRFNPGPAGIGVWITDGHGKTLAEISEYIGQATNNAAEWRAYLFRNISDRRPITRLNGALICAL